LLSLVCLAKLYCIWAVGVEVVCLLFLGGCCSLISFLLAASLLAWECELTHTHTTESFQFPWQPRASFVSFFFFCDFLYFIPFSLFCGVVKQKFLLLLVVKWML